jgi:hypothetical protein
MLGHEPLPWDGIKGLGDIFADLREIGAAATLGLLGDAFPQWYARFCHGSAVP